MNIYLSIGSNLGDREKNLFEAFERIKKIGYAKSSHIYESEPWGIKDQGNFLNAAIKLITEIEPIELLDMTNFIELEMGRKHKGDSSPRIIDIDIILMGYIIYMDKRLRVPHRKFRDRNFVLIPLNELGSNEVDPVTGYTISELLESCSDKGMVWETGILLQ